jgi:hypothetical protein
MSKELLAFLDKLHDHSITLLQGVKFDKQLEEDGYIICLYASMVSGLFPASPRSLEP